MSPLKAKRALCGSALQITKLRRAYRVLDFVQAPFGFVFWFIEQRKARLQDRIANLASAPDQFSAAAEAQDCSTNVPRLKTAGVSERSEP